MFYRLEAKNERISEAHSSARTPEVTVHFGWKGERDIMPVYPRFSSEAPYTTRRIWLHPMAPAHIGQGSTVT